MGPEHLLRTVDQLERLIGVCRDQARLIRDISSTIFEHDRALALAEVHGMVLEPPTAPWDASHRHRNWLWDTMWGLEDLANKLESYMVNLARQEEAVRFPSTDLSQMPGPP